MTTLVLVKRRSTTAGASALVRKVAGRPVAVGDKFTRAVLFLRSLSGRSALCHSAFYFYLFGKIASERPGERPIDEMVTHDTIRNCALFTLATSIRAIYDTDTKYELHAKIIANLGADDCERVAEYWGRGDAARISQARQAISFLSLAFKHFTKPINESARTTCPLTQRIALVKAFANRAVAHISLDDYAYSALDLAHIVAATAMLGAVARDFDEIGEIGADYLIGVDQTASVAARKMFPGLDDVPTLFQANFVRATLQPLYEGRLVDGVRYLSDDLLAALGWDD
jgi:hypothetical protein